MLARCFQKLLTKQLQALKIPVKTGVLPIYSQGKTDLAKHAKALNLDAIHDTVHEMARDEARHGKAFKGLLERYFGK